MELKNFMTQKRANVVLAFVGASWGLNYICMKISMEEMSGAWMVAFRFTVAFIAIALIFLKRLKNVNKEVIKASAVVGLLDAGMFVTLIQGLKFTTVTNAGFLCATSVVIVPILHAILQRKLPDGKVFLCCLIAIAGIACMTLKESLTISVYDLWCLACAFSYACWVLATSHYVKTCDGLQLGILQLGFTALYLIVFAAFTGPISLPTSGRCWFALLFMTVFCTAICYTLQTVVQKFTTPELASLMFCTEPVSSAFFGFLLFGEMVGLQGYLGAVLILLAVVLSTVKVKKTKAITS